MYQKLCTLTNQNTIRDLFDPFRGGYIQYFDLIFGNSLIHFGTAYVLFNTVQMTLSRVIDKIVVDEGRALQPCRYRLFTHMSCIILYPYST